ncbi:MAG: hypothetical protein AAGG09_12380 [Pseudomonadota bacterium]
MSTVLWAHHLAGQACLSDETDLPALYRDLDRLDRICVSLAVTPLSEMVDHTDAQVNMDALDLPAEMPSTTELMVRDGRWIGSDAAIDTLERLHRHLTEAAPRIGMMRDRRPQILAELEGSLRFARTHRAGGTKFNFTVVM